MAQTEITYTEPMFGFRNQALKEPKYIVHDGGIWTCKLQNTFQDKMGRIIAVWVIDIYRGPTPEEEAEKMRCTAGHHRRSGRFDAARYYEELAHKTEREYPSSETSYEFPGLAIT